MASFDNIRAWKLLLACASAKNLSSAAEAAGSDPASASRMLSRLEAETGVPLLDRSVRPPRPTEALEALVPAAKRIVRAHESAMEIVGAMHAAKPRKLRVSIPVNCARQPLLNAIFQFERRHAQVSVEVVADAGLENLLSGRVDVAFLGYRPNSPSLCVEALPDSVSCLMASKKYIRLHGEPKSVEDLLRRRILIRNSENRSFTRNLQNGRQKLYLSDDSRLRFGDADMCREALLEGEGIAADLSFGYMADELAAGTVVPVMPGWHRVPWTESIACPVRHSRDRLVRELMGTLHRARVQSFTDRWDFWYERFGIDPASVLEA